MAAAAAIPASAAAAGRGRPDPHAAAKALQRVKDLKRGIGVRTGRELTPALAELARQRPALDAAGRKQAGQLLARPTEGGSDPQGDGYTVAQATPVCGVNFCVHYVTSTTDAPSLTDTSPANGVPDYVEQMLDVFEDEVQPCENGTAALACAQAAASGLGWPAPPSDLTETPDNGGDGRFDVYIKELGTSIFGYAATDPQPSGNSLYSYMVMDDDYAGFGYADPLVPLRVTAAHEYNHVLQFGIDPLEDTWMFESTATWSEEKVYPAIDDYLNYMSTWVGSTADPLTDAGGGSGIKMYGSAVWNHFIEGRHGRDTILDAWQASTQVNGGPFAPASYGTAITAAGGSGFEPEFEDFSAATAEWRALVGSSFPDLYPDVPRGGSLTVGANGVTIQLDHTTFALRGIAVPASPQTLTLNATLPAGLKGAIALVGRTGGSTTSGTVTTQIARATNGGALSVQLPNAQDFGRITAVLINADPTQTGFNSGQGDWNFSKDNQNFSGVQVTTSTPATPPSVATGSASSVAATAATLNGTVNPNGGATTYWFEYGTTASYGSETTHASAGSGSSSSPQSAAVSGLTRGTTYHFRIVAQNSGGTVNGGDQTFTTLDPPIVATSAASGVGEGGATLNATVDPRGQATTYFFEYGPTTAYGSQIPLSPASAGSGTGATAQSAALTGLARGTTIHYRVVATNADGTSTGLDKSFRTLDPPVATTGAAGAITSSGAILTGTVDPRGRDTTWTFQFGPTTAYGSETPAAVVSAASGASTIGAQLAGLPAGTLFHYRLVATSSDGTGVGEDRTFQTAASTTGTTTGTTGGTTTGTTGGTNTTDGTGSDAGETTLPDLATTLAVSRGRLRRVLRTGLRLRAGCNRPCSVVARVTIPRRIARRLRLKRTVARGRLGSGDGTRALRVRFSRRARRPLGRLRSVRVLIVMTATDSDGNRLTRARRLTLRR